MDNLTNDKVNGEVTTSQIVKDNSDTSNETNPQNNVGTVNNTSIDGEQSNSSVSNTTNNVDEKDKATDENAANQATTTNLLTVKTEDISEEEKENKLRKEVASLDLKSLNVPLMYEMMSVPTYSDYEYRMVTWLILWARKHNIEHSFDDYGNLYFVKGKPKENEFYPCVTAHLDTVQDKAKAYILTGAELDLRTRKTTNGKHEVYIDGMGTGSDDKNAILIALHMFEKFDTLKGAFYLGEEIGCKGSNNMDDSFFDDVSYVIGFDSPELNRAAWRLMGNVKMFTAAFYKEYMKPICDKYGMTKFYSESITDEAHITQNTGLVTMNFGNGGYNAHATTEYFVVEELDHALSMGIELVETIPTNVQHKVRNVVWKKNEQTGNLYKTFEEIDSDDEAYLKTLGDNSKYSYYNNYSNNYSSNNYWNSKSNNNNNSNDKIKEEPKSYTEETVKYITESYEDYIKQIKEEIENQCKEIGVDFEKSFSSIFNKEIKF